MTVGVGPVYGFSMEVDRGSRWFSEEFRGDRWYIFLAEMGWVVGGGRASCNSFFIGGGRLRYGSTFKVVGGAQW